MPKVFRIRRHNLYPTDERQADVKGIRVSLTKQPVCLGRIIETSVLKVEGDWRAHHGQS
jgi:hypothetical protein